ncbi:uncharacterized protein LOC109614471 [Musca domestica]|uniref:Uncharacterized protein LOC109614471 n=1 Tax=Musca domestica TaxID=7370 RepID=A0A9J7DPS5_MUSDO|nr:uncharacterized protein LOC109614471 [Musca domestica]
MALNAFHIHGIIVGVLTLLVSLALMLFQGEMLVLLVKNKTDDSNTNISPQIIIIVTAVILCITSVLLIFGIVKKRPYLLLPWLTCMIIISLVFIITLFIGFLHLSSYKGILHIFSFIGFIINILYPIIALYLEIRQTTTGSVSINDGCSEMFFYVCC